MLKNSKKKNEARLFVCFEFKSDYFIKLQEKFISLENCCKIKLVKDFHMTLRYFGNTQINKIPEIIKKLNKIEFKKFTIKTSYLSYFDEKLPRVIFVGVENNNEFGIIKKQIDNLFKPEKFHPHITLARLKNIKDLKIINGLLKNLILESSKSFIIDKFFLIESTLTNFGPIYRVIETFNSH